MGALSVNFLISLVSCPSQLERQQASKQATIQHTLTYMVKKEIKNQKKETNKFRKQ
jgi:hypothetical protein